MNDKLNTARELRRKYRASGVQLSAALSLGANDTVAGLRLHASDLAALGYRRLLLALDDCINARPAEAVGELLTIKRKKSHIRRVDVCIAGEIDADSLVQLKNAGAATLIFPAIGNGANIARQAGIADVGLGMRFDADCDAQLEVLLNKASEISPREIVVRHAPELSSERFAELVAEIREACPMTGITVDSDEYELADIATTLRVDPAETVLDSLVNKLIRAKILPGFCTACPREGRCGDEYNSACEDGRMPSFCFLNSLLTLKEYLADFATQDTRIIGTDYVLSLLYTIKSDKLRSVVIQAMKDMRTGVRDYRF